VADRELTGVLLVGGSSTRYGSPKAHAVFCGETLAARAWRLLGDACAERIAVGRCDGLPFETLSDEGTGPVGGIAAALRAASHDVAVIVPVDMPLLTAAALRALADACRDAAVAQRGPLPCAVSRRTLPAFERGELRLRSVLAPLDTATVVLDDGLLANVNEPRDLERLSGGT
jgi:molybdopterin-guanine dinucleotide biosynthesis protein A